VCSSSMKKIAPSVGKAVWKFLTQAESFSMSPTGGRLSARIDFPARTAGTVPSAMRWAKAPMMVLFPTPGSPTNTGLFLVRRQRMRMSRSSSFSRPMSGWNWPTERRKSLLNSAWNEWWLARSRNSGGSCGNPFSSSRTRSRWTPRSRKTFAAKHFSSRNRPSKRCSVPMWLCDSCSASSAA
jgi:hypothetical protein